MRGVLSFILIFVAVSAVFAADDIVKFKDLPDNHWAAPAVYNLVRLGVTKGYPDGTFRGNKQITRYETALFLSKLAESLKANLALKTDVAELRKEIVALQNAPVRDKITGNYRADWKFCDLLASPSNHGLVASYRLQLSSDHKLGAGADVKINLDTMDYGYFSDGLSDTGGALATDLLDMTSDLQLPLKSLGLPNPVNVSLTVGPGPKQHASDPTGVISSEIGVTYMRPYTGVEADTTLWGAKLAIGYQARGHATSGRVTANNIFGTLAYEFKGVPVLNKLQVSATGQQISAGQYSSSDRNLRASLAVDIPFSRKIEAGGTLGLGGRTQSQWLVSGNLTLNDLWDTGTVAIIKAAKIGSNFIDSRFANEEIDLAGFDNFNRPLVNGSVNIGGQLVQTVADDLKVIGKGDIRLQPDYQYTGPKGRLTAEGGISYNIAPNTTLDAIYRIAHDKSAANSRSDLAALGLMYQF